MKFWLALLATFGSASAETTLAQQPSRRGDELSESDVTLSGLQR